MTFDTVAPRSTGSISESARSHALAVWIDANGGIVHRDAAVGAGYSLRAQRAAVRAGAVRRVRRNWLATAAAPHDLLAAAECGGRLACVSVARHRKWWIPDEVDDRVHVSLDPHGASPGGEVIAHWSTALAPAAEFGLSESVEDALAHIARCMPPDAARVLWESAVRVENLSVEALRRIPWPTAAARSCAEAVTGLSDSGLETIAVVKLSRWGIPLRQQVYISRRPVDLLIGERLIVQIDGYAHHSSAAQRSKDVAFDAELVLRGYTVLRFTYAQVVHDWPTVERTIARAIATGAHRA